MKRVLFVDDEPAALADLKAAAQGMPAQWHMAFAESGARALELMLKTPFDVVVTDAVMPGMDGAQLLTWVTKRFPQVVRIAMTSDLDAGAAKGLVGLAHQCLSKPCDAPTLQDAIDRALSAAHQLTDPKLKEIVSQIRSLPSVPAIYVEMLQELKEEDPSIPRLGHLISQDLGLTAKVLQLVNSAYFGLPQKVSNPAEAIFYLGIGTVKNIVLGLQSFAQFGQINLPGFSPEKLWQHSWRTGTLARELVELEGRPHLGDDAFTGGLLHDIGKLVLATGLPAAYREVLALWTTKPRPLCEIESERLGASHAEVGAYLLGLWGLPAAIVDGVGWHHRPGAAGKRDFTVATALHVANAIEHEQDTFQPGTLPLDSAYLTELGLAERVDVWRTELGQALAA